VRNEHPWCTLLLAASGIAAAACGRLDFDEIGNCEPSIWYVDADGDGHGDPSTSFLACTQPMNAVTLADDCDDSERYSLPSGVEVCDGIDNDCNPATVETCNGQCVPGRRLPPDDAHTYLLCGTNETWPMVRRRCTDEGFDLVVIDDGIENAWLRTAMDGAVGNMDVWLGGTDQTNEGAWETVTGSLFWQGLSNGSSVNGRYTNWQAMEPNNGGGTEEDCLLMLLDGTWNDASCEPTMRPFACERGG